MVFLLDHGGSSARSIDRPRPWSVSYRQCISSHSVHVALHPDTVTITANGQGQHSRIALHSNCSPFHGRAPQTHTVYSYLTHTYPNQSRDSPPHREYVYPCIHLFWPFHLQPNQTKTWSFFVDAEVDSPQTNRSKEDTPTGESSSRPLLRARESPKKSFIVHVNPNKKKGIPNPWWPSQIHFRFRFHLHFQSYPIIPFHAGFLATKQGVRTNVLHQTCQTKKRGQACPCRG